MSGSTSSLCAAGLGLLLGLGTATAVNAAADDLEEIVVTGSHIRGADVAGSKLIVIGVEQIEASGYGRVGDVLATVPQNFNRANEAVGEPGFLNLNHGSEVQLRGLGVGTTLTLVNGQRQGASGRQGSFTDVSTIPVSAIERIEILPEGASALNIFGDGSPTRSSISGSTTLSTSARPSSTNSIRCRALWVTTPPTPLSLEGRSACRL